MDHSRFRFFVVGAIAIGLGLSGYAWENAEKANSHTQSISITQQVDRETAVLKNVEARKDDCTQQNELRAGLRVNVEEGQKSIPLLLRAVPQLNTKEILAANDASVKKELRAFRAINCQEYALKALPPSEVHKLSLEEQQAELQAQQVTLTAIVKGEKEANLRSALSRVTTITQRCELTRHGLKVARHAYPQEVAWYVGSLAGCEKQLAAVKQEAVKLK